MKMKILFITLFLFMSGCATKDFGKLADIEPSAKDKMTCEDLEKEFFALQNYEDSVDEKAVTGQFKQMMIGGIWSVMADEKLEAIARKDIRRRTKELYELKIEKGCK